MSLVSVPEEQAREDQQELSFRLAKPDVKDWTMLCLAVIAFGWVLVLGYRSVFLGEGFPWLHNLVFILTPVQFLLRLDRFVNCRWSLQIADGTAYNTIKGAVQKSLVIKESVISGGSLFSGEVQVQLPDDWVGPQPAKLLAALSLVRQGATLSELVKESLKQPENPKVVWVEDASFFETDGTMLMAFGILFGLFGFSLMAKSSSDWLMLAFGVLLFSAGLYVSARNWRSKGDAASIGYRIDGSILSGKADGQIDTLIDLAKDKLTVQYWNGLTRHSLRIGWVDQKGTFRALTHWQDKITEDISRIVTAAAAHGNLPEVVKWSVPK
jgi:hypothetical protein